LPGQNTEPLANVALADALCRRHPLWTSDTVHAEKTQLLRNQPGQRPDILIDVPGYHPVVVETEFEPAYTVESDALSRLGRKIRETGAPVEGVLAVKPRDQPSPSQGRRQPPRHSSQHVGTGAPRDRHHAGRRNRSCLQTRPTRTRSDKRWTGNSRSTSLISIPCFSMVWI